MAINFPLYVTPGSNTELKLSYNDLTYLGLLGGDTNDWNKTMVLYSNFCFLKKRELFKSPPASVEEIKGAIRPYLDIADAYIEKFGVKNGRVKRYMQVWAMNNCLEDLFGLPQLVGRNGAKATLPEDYYHLSRPVTNVYNCSEALLFGKTPRIVSSYIGATSKNSGTDAYQRLEKKFINLQRSFKNRSVKEAVTTAELEKYTRSSSFGPNSDFSLEEAKFRKLAQHVKNEARREELIRDFRNLECILKSAPMPDVAFKDKNGQPVNLRSFKGKYVYVDLWASWCKPHRR